MSSFHRKLISVTFAVFKKQYQSHSQYCNYHRKIIKHKYSKINIFDETQNTFFTFHSTRRHIVTTVTLQTNEQRQQLSLAGAYPRHIAMHWRESSTQWGTRVGRILTQCTHPVPTSFKLWSKLPEAALSLVTCSQSSRKEWWWLWWQSWRCKIVTILITRLIYQTGVCRGVSEGGREAFVSKIWFLRFQIKAFKS